MPRKVFKIIDISRLGFGHKGGGRSEVPKTVS